MYTPDDLRSLRDEIIAHLDRVREGEADKDPHSIKHVVERMFHERLSHEFRRDSLGGATCLPQ